MDGAHGSAGRDTPGEVAGRLARRELRRTPNASSLLRAGYRVLLFIFFLVLPVYSAARFGYLQHTEGILGFDFEGTIYEPAAALLSGDSPYPDATPSAVDIGNPSVYPAAGILLGVPFALLPYGLAEAVWIGAMCAAFVGTLLLLGVRDWRCYGFAFASFPVMLGITFGNFTIFLLPLAALAWRYRDRPWIVVPAVTALVTTKLFLWPLLLWLLATRRYRSFAASVVATAVVTALSWAVVGIDHLRTYPQLLDVLTDLYAPPSASPYAVGLALGLSEAASQAVVVVLGGAVLALSAYVGFRRKADLGSFSAGLAAAIVLSPIVWPHYFALLLVPVAIARKRLSAPWLVLIIGWWTTIFLPHPKSEVPCCGPLDVSERIWDPLHSPPALWPTILYLAVGAAVLVHVAARPQRPAKNPALGG